MKKVTRIAVLAMAMTMAISTLGATVSAQTAEQAGSSVSFTDTSTKKNIKAKTAADDAIQELADALDGTIWIGMNIDNTCYAMHFNGVKITIIDNNGQSLKGYWAVSSDTLYIYSNKEMTKEIVNYSWDFDSERDLLILDDSTYLYQSNASTSDEVKAELDNLYQLGKNAE